MVAPLVPGNKLTPVACKLYTLTPYFFCPHQGPCSVLWVEKVIYKLSICQKQLISLASGRDWNAVDSGQIIVPTYHSSQAGLQCPPCTWLAAPSNVNNRGHGHCPEPCHVHVSSATGWKMNVGNVWGYNRPDPSFPVLSRREHFSLTIVCWGGKTSLSQK